MKRFIFPILLLTMSRLAFSQGAFLGRDTSGFEFGGDFSGGFDSSYAAKFRVGVSYFGIVDFGLSIGGGREKEWLNGSEPRLQYLAFSPAIRVNFLKQDAHIPLSLSFLGSYESDEYSSDYLDRNNFSMTGLKSSFGGSIYRYFPINSTMRIQPSIGVGYTEVSTVFDNDSGWVRTLTGYPYYEVGCDFLFKPQAQNALRVGVAVGRANDNTTLSFRISDIVSAVRRYHHYRGVVAPIYRVYPEPPAQDQLGAVIFVNIPDSRGGYISVKLIKTQNGYLGPEGEFYPSMPTVAQLEALYGN